MFRFSIPQIPPQLPFRPFQGAADGAFVDSAEPGDFGDLLILYVVSQQDLPLHRRQLLFDDPVDSFICTSRGSRGPS